MEAVTVMPVRMGVKHKHNLSDSLNLSSSNPTFWKCSVNLRLLDLGARLGRDLVGLEGPHDAAAVLAGEEGARS